ncbi:MAG UNVERIFIED_CONTAM: RNA pyrophosphohydrolase [Rickettsiaceae bacterium]
MQNDISTLPYRKGVGMMIVNNKGQVFLGKRLESKYESWQMPQGGILTGETPSKAVKREMKEELGCDLGEILAETSKWYSYKIPEFLVSKLWEGKYKGQQQKWFLIKFTGQDSDININTDNPEFREWLWADVNELLEIIVPFKKMLYEAILEEFLPIVNAHIKNNAK